MLSLLELMVAAAGPVGGAVVGPAEGWASSPTGVQHGSGSGGDSGVAGAGGAGGQARELLVGRVRERVGGALGRLPGAVSGTLWAAVECMCEAA